MRSILSAGRAPFDEEKLIGVLNVAGCLMRLDGQLLDVLDRCIGPDNVEELLVVGNKLGCVEVGQPKISISCVYWDQFRNLRP